MILKQTEKKQESGIICFTETFLDQSKEVLPEDIGRIDMKLFRFDHKSDICIRKRWWNHDFIKTILQTRKYSNTPYKATF